MKANMKVEATFDQKDLARSATKALMNNGFGREQIVLQDAGEQTGILPSRMNKAMSDELVVGPGVVGTRRMWLGAGIGSGASAVAGGLVAFIIGLMFFGPMGGTHTRDIAIVVFVGVVAGAVAGLVAGGLLQPETDDVPNNEEKHKFTVQVRSDDPKVLDEASSVLRRLNPERITGSDSSGRPIRI